MTPQIFAYIVQRNGQSDDSAAELLAAAKKIDGAAAPIAIVTGAGPEAELACSSLPAGYAEAWKIAKDTLAYPDAELVRQALVQVLPRGSIVLLSHDHFAIDLGPGLSIKMNAAYVADVTAIGGVVAGDLQAVRQEFGGQVSTHVACGLSQGAVLTIRPGAFRAPEAEKRGLPVIDKSGALGNLSARRRYLQTVLADAGDVDITRHSVLVSVGRGLQEKDNLEMVQELADALGAAVSCSRPVVAGQVAAGRFIGQDGEAQGLPGLRHQRRLPAPGRAQGKPVHHRHQ
jgi:electron transfer flavoprotein alpha subunit